MTRQHQSSEWYEAVSLAFSFHDGLKRRSYIVPSKEIAKILRLFVMRLLEKDIASQGVL